MHACNLRQRDMRLHHVARNHALPQEEGAVGEGGEELVGGRVPCQAQHDGADAVLQHDGGGRPRDVPNRDLLVQRRRGHIPSCTRPWCHACCSAGSPLRQLGALLDNAAARIARQEVELGSFCRVVEMHALLDSATAGAG